MRASRLLDMLLLLQRRGRLTAGELAIELEVSPRTVLRDVEALGAAGVPIFTTQGAGGGIELVDGFRTDLTGVTDAEAETLWLAAQPTVAEALGLGRDAASVRRKLVEALPDGSRQRADGLNRWFLHDPIGPAGAKVPARELARLARAIALRLEVEARFAGTLELVLCPLGLVLTAGRWVVVDLGDAGPCAVDLGDAGPCAVALGDAGPCAVDLDDLMATRLTRRRFERPAGFDLARCWEELSARG